MGLTTLNVASQPNSKYQLELGFVHLLLIHGLETLTAKQSLGFDIVGVP